jgi:hypothetical protein
MKKRRREQYMWFLTSSDIWFETMNH